MLDPALVVAALALGGAVISGYFALRSKKVEVRASNDANLRDDQREFIAEMRATANDARRDAQAERSERGRLEVEIERLRAEIAELRNTLIAIRRELAETQRELREEREARQVGEDAGALRQQKSEERVAGLDDGVAEEPK